MVRIQRASAEQLPRTCGMNQPSQNPFRPAGKQDQNKTSLNLQVKEII